ncbi:extracellular solute-binding protein [Hamadaea sp.]|uniref:sugar ABC transporter substrate-binding protein n=1 Tax=Hamadaea sp. TaxID=2024425 RepID=UPI0025C4F6AE|nr:extracellular solute-binding protein [Hamadaea sp.]
MKQTASRRRAVGVALVALVAAGALVACSSEDKTGASGDGGTYTIWDPYPQFDDSSNWVKLLNDCGSKAGVTVKRTAFDTSDLTSKTLLAAQQGNAPDVLIVDNPVISTLAEAGVLTTSDDIKLDTSAIDPNLLGAGQSGGKTFGIPIGANTLALYYNKTVLTAAGVDIASVKDWASLTAALAKVTAAGKKGITFSAIGTEEGSFQFLPWFWGSGANLTKLDSPEAVSALSLWTDWLKKGYAPNSVINNTQTTSWQEFATGQYAFAENGTWQLANAKKTGFEYGIIAVPGISGGTAAAPTGGEFVSVPVQKSTARYAVSQKLVACLTDTDNSLATTTTLSYIAPTAAVQAKQVAANPELKVWVDAVKAAKGRTGDNLGTKYPKISQPMWTAVQAALSGSASPQAALATAQTAAAAATK